MKNNQILILSTTVSSSLNNLLNNISVLFKENKKNILLHINNLKEIKSINLPISNLTNLEEAFFKKKQPKIIIYDDKSTLKRLPNFLLKSKKIVFVFFDITNHRSLLQRIDFSTQLIISDNPNYNYSEVSIFKKQIIYLPTNFSDSLKVISKNNNINKRKVALFISESNNANTILFNCITAFNKFFNIEFLIFDFPKNISYLKAYTNDNIKFVENTNKQYEVDLVIADRQNALLYALENFPVVVLGEYGIGGLLTPDNYKKMAETNFKGRIGGVLYETISSHFLFEYLEYQLQNLSKLNFQSNKIKNLLQEYKDSQKDTFLQFFQKLLKYDYEKEIIIFHNDIKIIKDITVPKQYFLLRNNGKIITIFSSEELNLYKLILKGVTFKDLLLETKYNKNDLENFISELQKLNCLKLCY